MAGRPRFRQPLTLTPDVVNGQVSKLLFQIIGRVHIPNESIYRVSE